MMITKRNDVVFAFLLITIATSSGVSATITSFSNGSSSAMDQVRCRESERQALLRFKQDLVDPSNRLSSWDVNGEADCCSWAGVACDDFAGHVTELRLGNPYHDNDMESNVRLSGKINPSLLDLQYLTYLNLSDNAFEGIPIPSFLGSFKSLTHLDLSHACFEGEVPHQLGNLSKLHYLNLRDINPGLLKIEKLEWISGLNSLQFLDMSGINMSKVYDLVQALHTLPSLVELRLAFCKLGPVPSLDHLPMNTIINFTSLSIFDVNDNDLVVLPKWLFSLKNLHSICCSSNSLGGSFPLGLANMTHLKILDLSWNSLNSASIPLWIGCLGHLEILDLGRNDLQGDIPESIGNLTSMVSLDLSGNQLKGEIPESLGNLSKLRELQLSYNQLSAGQFANQLGNFRNLISLSINNNQLNGSLAESLGQLAKLEYLDISHSGLKGVVHEVHFANLSGLKVFIASGNSLKLETSPDWVPPFQAEILLLNSWDLGAYKLPSWLRRQQHLSELDISNAGIVGTLPIWFCNISSQLTRLNLSLNQFYGPFPCSVTPSLDCFDISSNQFSGSLMPFSTTSISILDSSDNSFSGSVTHFCANSSFLGAIVLSLGNNLLTGEIPNCWNAVFFFNLENNNLVGVIPPSLGNLTVLRLLNLRNNRLSGEFPLWFRNYTELVALDLGGNKLIGKIPPWIGTSLPDAPLQLSRRSSSRLVILNLRSNNFEGDVPLQFCNLTSLQVLDLAHNNLSGTIPRCFCNLNAMITLPNLDERPSILASAIVGSYFIAEAEVVTKGRGAEYSTVLNLVRSMDLSANNFHGEIPTELTKLNLQTLNLSQNHLVGKIPSKIGDMRWLESLDLSENQLSGEIPPSISGLSFLSYLNLSCNNLTGRIPTGTQLQTFKKSSFIGNRLCGPPISQNCSATNQSMNPTTAEHKHDNYLYLSLGLGFSLGFWAVLGSLLFNLPLSLAFARVVAVLKLQGFVIEIF